MTSRRRAAAASAATAAKIKVEDNDNVNDEHELLATIAGAAVSIQQQDVYEDRVIQEATQQLAPSLSLTAGVGFPPLHSLAPSYTSNARAASSAAAASVAQQDLPHFYTMLSQTRKATQKAQAGNNNNSNNDNSLIDRLYLQEQMILCYLSQVGNIADDDLPIRSLHEERMNESKRSQQIQEERRIINYEQEQQEQQQQGVAVAIKEEEEEEPSAAAAAAASGDDENNRRRNSHNNKILVPRIPMMKRKQYEDGGHGQQGVVDGHGQADKEKEDEDFIQQKEQLRKLRAKRRRDKQQRRKALLETLGSTSSDSSSESESSSSTSEEEEFDDDDDEEEEEEDNGSGNGNGDENGGNNGENDTAVTAVALASASAVGVAVKQEDTDNNNDTTAAAAAAAAATSAEVAVKQEEDTTTTSTTTTTTSSTTICPLCSETVSAPDMSQLDAVLSQHMNECQQQQPQRRRGPSRRTRGRSSVAAGAGASESQDHDEDDEYMPPPQPPVAKRRKTTLATAAKKKKTKKKKGKRRRRKSSTSSRQRQQQQQKKNIDDMDELDYEDRVDDWIDNGLSRMKVMKERSEDDVLPGEQMLSNNLYVPGWVNDRLFEYQRHAIKWLWNLHQQDAGVFLGDEMGLGKTVQVASYLGILAASRKLKSVLIIAPATMIQHWINELAVWAPGIRRVVIHQSAFNEQDGYSRTISMELLRSLARWLKRARADRLYEAIDEQDLIEGKPHSFCGTAYAVITTYENVRRNADVYTRHPWSYAVLDEAQKIRNPDADVTLELKRLPTTHRIAMSGTPIQNDLRELWSLFDFVFPGRLGTLPAFEQEFADPIKRGGYSNVTPMQVQLAYRCALTLKDLIEPYLLRRRKKDVAEVARMPGKTEHVLFCRLSDMQRTMYSAYLQSDSVMRVLRGNGQLLAAVCMLRKICNHPDLVCDPNDQASFESFVKNGYVNSAGGENNNEGLSDMDEEDGFGGGGGDDETLVERSGKLEVLSKILPLWHKQGHRVLVFCQWRKMLDIIQRFMMIKGWKFCRLDGNTNIATRQRLVDSFNNDDSYFCMLCTTRTGGVGLNLTGANRIILYDPDFNPQTDAQARERAWRFGQEREVTVYRLITAGAVEEKIYQRQIFKTALSNTVLQDPKQRRLFSQRDLRDLFTLKADTGSVRSGGDGITETSEATRGVGVVGPDDEEAADEDDASNKDNEETLRKVMRSKGLAGVFDHNYIEQDSKRKSLTAREMEEQAKLVAREAVSALRQSVSEQHNPFEPESRFGSSKGSSGAAFGRGSMRSSSQSQRSTGSDTLLASIRQRNVAVETQGVSSPPSDEAKRYAKLLARIRDYVRCRKPTTDELLQAFDSDIPNSEVAAIFRRLLKSIATLDKSRWSLDS